VGSDTDITVADTGGGPFYSVTAVYTITAPTFGTVTADAGILDAVIVPEPGALALLGAALAGFGVIARRRRGAA
jgi:acetyl-CoA carboxylase beta subunit